MSQHPKKKEEEDDSDSDFDVDDDDDDDDADNLIGDSDDEDHKKEEEAVAAGAEQKRQEDESRKKEEEAEEQRRRKEEEERVRREQEENERKRKQEELEEEIKRKEEEAAALKRREEEERARKEQEAAAEVENRRKQLEEEEKAKRLEAEKNQTVLESLLSREVQFLARLEELNKKDLELRRKTEELQEKIEKRRKELQEEELARRSLVPTLEIEKVGNVDPKTSVERKTTRGKTPRTGRKRTASFKTPREEEDDTYDESDHEDDDEEGWSDEDAGDDFDRMHVEAQQKRSENEERQRKEREEKQKREHEEKEKQKKEQEERQRKEQEEKQRKEQEEKQRREQEEKKRQAEAAAASEAAKLSRFGEDSKGKEAPKISFEEATNVEVIPKLAIIEKPTSTLSPRGKSPRSISATLPKINRLAGSDERVAIDATLQFNTSISPRRRIKSVEGLGSLTPEDEPIVFLPIGEDLSVDVRMRNNVINEVIQTERDYINDLKLMIRLFRDPIRESDYITEKDINIIFGNLQMLLGVNQELLRDLHKQSQAPSPMIGSSFSSLADYLKVYSSYCSSHHVSLEHLDGVAKKHSKLSAFLQDRLSHPDCRGLPLSSYLIKPVQRICKYPLLLRELIKHTPPENADKKKLEDAFNKINSVVLEVNESQRANENRKKIIDLQSRLEGVELFGQLVSPSRFLIKEGSLQEINSEVVSASYILFNDLLVRAIPRKNRKLAGLLGPKKKEDMLVIQAWMSNLQKLEVQSLTDTPSYKHIFEIKDNIHKFMVHCNTPAEKEEWLQAFKEAKELSSDDASQAKTKSLNKSGTIKLVSLKKKKGNH